MKPVHLGLILMLLFSLFGALGASFNHIHLQSAENSTLTQDHTHASSSGQEESCKDPCHIGRCHFGHCSVVLSLSDIQFLDSKMEMSRVHRPQSNIVAPFIEGLKRPPKSA